MNLQGLLPLFLDFAFNLVVGWIVNSVGNDDNRKNYAYHNLVKKLKKEIGEKSP